MHSHGETWKLQNLSLHILFQILGGWASVYGPVCVTKKWVKGRFARHFAGLDVNGAVSENLISKFQTCIRSKLF